MKMYIPTDIIAKKRDDFTLDAQEIAFMVEGFTNDTIPDYQFASFLMALFLRGITDKETIALTNAMIKSGDIVDLSDICTISADKHSTGGVGDKTTPIIVPILAACGIKTVKMSGRGLCFTGGTIDKLESISGYRTVLTENEIKEQIKKIGAVMIGATHNIAPADKKIYALRDATATVENIGLIASSIMSKKIACGADIILIDIKTGSGAFMKTQNDAEELSRILIKIGSHFGKKVDTIISPMNDVLGNAVGNLIEMREVYATLKGHGPNDLIELCCKIAQKIIELAEIDENAKEILASGRALKKFEEIVVAQNGDIKSIDDKNRNAKYSFDIKAQKSGIINEINVSEIGFAASMLGAGRMKKEDVIDAAAGIIVNKKLTDRIKVGETIATLYTNNEKSIEAAATKVYLSYKITS